jgi:hypothetical protein
VKINVYNKSIYDVIVYYMIRVNLEEKLKLQTTSNLLPTDSDNIIYLYLC